MPPDPVPPTSRQVDELLRPHRKLLARLRRADLSKTDLVEALRQVTELAAAVLDVERASVWRLADGGQRLVCLDLFQREAGEHSAGAEIALTAVPAYFAALQTERWIAADDAGADPRTAEFRDGYLVPNGIGAMLDSPIFVRGEMVGVVCQEHVGGVRRWNLWEELVAATLGDFVAYVLEAEERAKELRASEESFRRLFEAAPTPMVLARVSDGKLALFNPRAKEIMAIPDDVGPYELLASTFYERLEDRERILQDLRTAGFVEGREVPMRSLDGKRHWCLLSARTLVYRNEAHIAVGISDVSGLKEIEDRLREAAMRDPLTGVYNRRHFYDAGRRELERARRYDRPVSIAMLDADHFKEKNDRHGHGVGDEILVALAHTMKGGLRQSDMMARYGGEEFVVLFPETDLDEAERVTERLRASIAASPVPTAAGPVAVTVSAGVVGWARGEESLESFIGRADRALYEAKGLGRDRVQRG